MDSYVKVELEVYKAMIDILIAQPYANVATVRARLNDGKSVEVVEAPPVVNKMPEIITVEL